MSENEGFASARPTFGLALYTGQAADVGATSWYSDAVPLARAAEAAGFDTFWVSEHHGFDDGYLPAPLTVLAAVAAATSSIGLGSGVVLGPLRHPIRLAEEAAVLDQISRGRLILGLGLGYMDDELRAFETGGVSRGLRLEALIDVLRLAWTGETFSHEGAGMTFDRVRVTPTPFGGRQIPVLLGAYAPVARARSARLGDGHIVGRGTVEIVSAALGDIEAAGGPARTPFSLVVNVAAILDEPGGHGAAALGAFDAQQRVYEGIQVGRDVYGGQVPGSTDDGGLTLGTIDAYVQVRGSADVIVEYCQKVLDSLPSWSAPHLALRIIFPEPDLTQQIERIEAFGERVLRPLRSG